MKTLLRLKSSFRRHNKEAHAMKGYANRQQFIIHLVRFFHIYQTSVAVAVLQTGVLYLLNLIMTST